MDTYTPIDDVSDLVVDDDVIIQETHQETVEILSDNETRLSPEIKVESTRNEPESSSYQVEETNHPYSYIIDSFEYLPEQLKITPEIQLKSIVLKKYQFVTSRNDLKVLLGELRNVHVIAVELFKGVSDLTSPVSLLGISTLDKDYLIDAKALQAQLVMLTEIFINPKILKIVFTGKNTCSALQTSLDLYLINIFDMYEARKQFFGETLSHQLALAQLLKYECKFERPKIRTRDFTKRPISNDVRKFCRSTTHFLFAIYDKMKNELVQNKLHEYKQFLDKCRQTTKLVTDSRDFHKTLLAELEKDLKRRHDCELYVLKALADWRREMVEKCGAKYTQVLPDHEMVKLVRVLPTEDTFLFTLTESKYIRNEAATIKKLIAEARERFQLKERQARKQKKVQKAKPSESKKRKTPSQKKIRRELKRRKAEQQQVQPVYVSVPEVAPDYGFQDEASGNGEVEFGGDQSFQNEEQYREAGMLHPVQYRNGPRNNSRESFANRTQSMYKTYRRF